MSKQDWRYVDLASADDSGEANNLDRLVALAEYRQCESIDGWFLASREEVDATDDPSDLGPTVSEIDWSGFDAACSAAVKAGLLERRGGRVRYPALNRERNRR